MSVELLAVVTARQRKPPPPNSVRRGSGHYDLTLYVGKSTTQQPVTTLKVKCPVQELPDVGDRFTVTIAPEAATS